MYHRISRSPIEPGLTLNLYAIAIPYRLKVYQEEKYSFLWGRQIITRKVKVPDLHQPIVGVVYEYYVDEMSRWYPQRHRLLDELVRQLASIADTINYGSYYNGRHVEFFNEHTGYFYVLIFRETPGLLSSGAAITLAIFPSMQQACDFYNKAYEMGYTSTDNKDVLALLEITCAPED